MPDLSITVCGREFPISCGEGEEQILLAAAALLDAEARALLKSDERLTELRILLMAGLVLADRTNGLQRDLRLERERVRELETAVGGSYEARPAVAQAALDSLSDLADRAEAVAATAEEKASSKVLIRTPE